jgi:adenine-specific DNA-methyltransferase
LASTQAAIRTIRGIQQSFPLPTLPAPSERLLPSEPKGAVYTKRWVVDLLLDLAGYTSGMNLVDVVAVEPAAGEGSFLGPMAERLVDSCQRLGRPISDCSNALIAYELNETSAERARMLVVRVLADRGVDASTAGALARSWVCTGDYLVDSMAVQADFVIGNPPYIRLEDIPDETAMLYRNAYPTMRGRADLYVAFFEAALRQLKDEGTCAFICADRWMRNHYGAELRDVITSSFAVDVIIEMHNANAFHEEVDAYPAVTVIRRHKQASTVVARAGMEMEGISTNTLLTALLDHADGRKAAMPRGLRAARVDRWFQGRDPWPCHSPEQLALLRRLEEKFPLLEASAKVGIGVATGNDKVFVTKDADLVEPSRLLKLAMAKDLTSGRMVWSGHYLVDPWNRDGLVKLQNYPRLCRYFEQHGDALKRRHTAIRNSNGWYKTIDRVTHGLTEKRKLYIADIKNVLDPVLDSGETYPHHNLYFIESDDWNLEVLGGLLISAVGQFFIESYGVRMRGGYMRFQAQYLRRIRVPHPNAILETDAKKLTNAFRSRDRHLATETALRIYGIGGREMEIVIGH